MNLVLHGIEDFQIVREDTLRNPAFSDASTGGLATFDCVIANPPFSLKEWGERSGRPIPGAGNFAGLPPESYGDYAWVQHMVASMAPTVPGAWRSCCPRVRCSARAPRAASARRCWRGSTRGRHRPGSQLCSMAPGSPPAILVLRKKKPAQRHKKVLIADASALLPAWPGTELPGAGARLEIQRWFEKFEDVQDAVRVVSLDDIKAEDWTLNISRYVLPPLQEDIPPLPEAIAAFKDALTRCRQAEDRLAKVMSEGGWLQ